MIGRKSPAFAVGATGDASDHVVRHDRGRAAVCESQESVLGGEKLRGGVERAVFDAEHAAAVGVLERCGRGGEFGGRQLDGGMLGAVGDEPGDRFQVGDRGEPGAFEHAGCLSVEVPSSPGRPGLPHGGDDLRGHLIDRGERNVIGTQQHRVLGSGGDRSCPPSRVLSEDSARAGAPLLGEVSEGVHGLLGPGGEGRCGAKADDRRTRRVSPVLL